MTEVMYQEGFSISTDHFTNKTICTKPFHNQISLYHVAYKLGVKSLHRSYKNICFKFDM